MTDTGAARIVPHSLEAEMCVLGAMVLDNECISEVVQILRPQHFYRHDHRLIYDMMLNLYESNKPIDLVILRDGLERRGQLEKIGGVDCLMGLVHATPSAANAGYYAGIVRDKALLRELIVTSGKITELAFSDSGDVAELLEEAEQQIFRVTEKKITGQPVSMKEIITSVCESLETRSAGITGLPTGFLVLDELLCGLQPGEVIIVAARPSMGKTALGLNIAEHVSVDKNIPVALFSLEMSQQQLAERILASRSRIDSHNMRRGFLSEEDHEKLKQASDEFIKAPIYVDDSQGLTPLDLRAKARRLKVQHGVKLIIVDYLQLMTVRGKESRFEQIGIISRHLKALARELEVPVLVMSQLNRGPEGREGHRPRMSDLRESGNIEQDADVVILLHREDYYHTESDYVKTNKAELIIAKQRNGPTGNINLTWHPEWTRFDTSSDITTPY